MTWWAPKDYQCICPICNEEYVVTTEFLSGSTDAKGRVIAQCGKHSREEVRANYESSYPEQSRYSRKVALHRGTHSGMTAEDAEEHRRRNG